MDARTVLSDIEAIEARLGRLLEERDRLRKENTRLQKDREEVSARVRRLIDTVEAEAGAARAPSRKKRGRRKKSGSGGGGKAGK